MKKSKISILLLFLVMILAISAVSAADANDTSDSNLKAVDEAPVDEVASEDVGALAATDSNNVLSTGGDNFTKLQNLIDTGSGAIELESNFTRVDDEASIVINKAITINGYGFTIDGNNNGGIFRIGQGGSVTLNNVILINGNTTNGGAIYNEGTLTIVDSQLNNNNASVGGAIYNNGYLILTGSTLNDNTATSGLSIYNNGNLSSTRNTINGPIVNTGEGRIVSNIIVTVLDNNVRTVKEQTVILNATITDTNNNVINQIGDLFKFTVDGAVVGVASFDPILNNYHCTYTLTTPGIYTVNVTYDGGSNLVISSKDKNLRNIRGTFTDLQNMITASTGDLSLDYNITYNDVVDAANFTSGIVINKAININGNGYTISGSNAYRIFNVTANNVIIRNVTLTKGKADYGGAIYVGNGGNLTTDAKFVNNTATRGGAIYTTADTTVDKSNFIKNTATYGAAIYAASGNLTVRESTFNEDEAVNIKNGANATISTSRFTSDNVYAINNNGTLALAGNTVKAIYNDGTITSVINVVVLEGSTPVYVDGPNVKLYANITDGNNNPISQSGFKFLVNNEERQANFNENTLLYEAVYTFTSFGNYDVNMTYTGTASNVVITNGTINYMTGTFTDLQRLIDNTPAGGTLELPYDFTYDVAYDGANFPNGVVIDEVITIDGKGYTISGSDANRIFSVTSKAAFNNITFENGKAYDGGAIYATTSINITNSTFANNLATRYGGAVCVIATGSNAVVKVENSIFDNDTACQGGAIFHQNAKLIVDNSLFNENKAIGYVGGEWGSGPAILSYLTSALEVYNSNFTANYAQYNGGAIYFYNSNVPGTGVIDNCRFEDNVAGDSYGTIYVTNCGNCEVNFNINNTKFINNTNKATTADYGSAALLFMGNNLTINNTEFIDNNGTKYSAVYYYARSTGTLTIDKTNFTNNIARVGQAIIDIINGKAVITNAKFDSNNAVTYGEAIYVRAAANVEIKDSTFTNNGGSTDFAIYNLGTLALDKNTISNFIYNGGTINSQIIATVLDNKTYETKEDTYTLNATLTDDNGNLINDSSLRFVINNVKDSNVPAYDETTGLYTYADYPITLDKGTYTVGVALDTTSDLVVKTGIVKNLKVGTFTDLKAKLDAVTGDTFVLPYNFTYNAGIDGDLKVIILNKTIDGKGFTISGNNSAAVFIVNATVTIKNTIFADVKDYAIFNNNTLTLTNNTISQTKALIINNGTIDNAVVKVLDNKTVNLKFNQKVILNATFKDDNGNWINDTRFTFTVTNVSPMLATYNDATGLYTFEYTVDKVETKIVSVDNIGAVAELATGTLNIARASVNITIGANETIERKQKESINITFKDEFGKLLDLQLEVDIINSTSTVVRHYSPTTTNGFWSIEVPGLGIDNYRIEVLFTGNDNYAYKTVSKTFEVVQLDITNTFTELQEFIQNHTGTDDLVLPHNFKYNDYVDEDFYADGVVINKDITIDGNGTTIDSDKVYRIFNIADGVTVTIKNVTFINGNASIGAAILTNASSLTIDSCNFFNGNSSDGGAIYIKGGNVTVTGETLFKNNTASMGGAIFVATGGNLTVNGAEFDNNTAVTGSAIVVGIGAISTLNDAKFTNTAAKTNYTITNFGTLALSSNDVDKIIYNDGNITTPVYSTVLGNTTYKVETTTINISADLTDGKNKIYDPKFRFVVNGQTIPTVTYNATTGLYNATFDTTPDVRAYVVNVTSANEKKLSTKISIFKNVTGTFTELQGLIDNTAAGATLELPYDFAYIAAVDGDRFPEGVLINKAITIDGKGYTISGSNSKRIFRVTAATTLNNITLIEGNAIEFGGAIYTTANLNVYNSTFDHNVASKNYANGGAIMAEASVSDLTLNIKNVTFTNNVVDNAGGAIAAVGVGHKLTYNIYDSLFENNTAVTTGAVDAVSAGAIYSLGEYGETIGLINNTIFRENKALTGKYANGGAIKVEFGAVLTVANSTFDSNVANRTGGAISVQAHNDQTRLTVDNCTFTNNGASEGSAIESVGHYDSAHVSITRSKFNEDNAVVLDSHTTATISNSEFTSNANYAIYNLGKLKLSGNTVKVIFNNGTITTQVNSTVKENKTYDITKTTTYRLNASLVDDNNNKIYDPNFRFVINGETISTVPGYDADKGEYNFTLDTTTERIYLVDVTSVNEKMLSTKTSIVREITGTFTDLQKQIDTAVVGGNSLNLLYDFIYTPEIDEGKFDEGVLISTKIAIDGKGHTISGNNSKRIFNVTAKEVVLENLTIVNGSAIGGGAIYVSDGGDLEINKASFENNYAVSGADILVMNGGKLTVTETTFNDDDAVYNFGNATISTSRFTSEKIWAIYNLGNLSLSGNTVKLIYNGGKITSTVNATFIEGKTVDAKLGEKVNPNATLTDDKGNPIEDARFNITVRGTELETTFDNSTFLYSAEYTIVKAGDNLVTANYSATIKNTGIYSVPKANVTNFTIIVGGLEGRVAYGENATMVITLLGVDGIGLTETIGVIVNDTPISVDVIDGEAIVNISGLAPGKYAAVGYFINNDNYNDAYATGPFTVLYPNAILNVTVEDITYGNITVVNITLDNGTGGLIEYETTIRINISGTETVVYMIGGKASVEIPYLFAANEAGYLVNVTFVGDENYDPVSNDTEIFKVHKASIGTITISASALEVEAFDIVTFDFTIPIEGEYLIYENDKHKTVRLAAGEFRTSANFTVGNYTIKIVYPANDNYTEAVSNEINITVKPKVINPDSIYVLVEGDYDNPLNITLWAPVDGEYLIDLGTGYKYPINVTGGIGNMTIAKLDSGNYTYTIDIVDGNYSLETIEGTFKYKAYPSFTVNITGTYPTATITISGSSGNYTVYIDDKEYVVEVKGTEASAPISFITAGNHVATVVLNESKQYYSGVIPYYEFTIAQANLTVEPEVIGELIVDGPINITFKLPTAVNASNVAALSDGVLVKELLVNETTGVYTVVFDGFAAGGHAFTVNVNDPNYVFTFAVKEFFIEKHNSTMETTVTPGEITYGDNVTISVNVGVNATGFVVIDVNGTECKVYLVNGVATKEIAGLNAGNYDVTVTYGGDDKYNNVTGSAKFTINKAESKVSIEPIADVIYGNPVEIVYEIINETSFVNIEIVDLNNPGKQIAFIDSNVLILVNDLAAGNYSITIHNGEDGNYNESSATAKFNVLKNSTEIITEKEINSTIRDDVEIDYEILPAGVNDGNVTLWINDKEYGNFTIDRAIGSIKILSQYLPVVDTYVIKVQYRGNENYTESNVAVITLTVNKINITNDISIEGSQITYGETGTITVDFGNLANVTGTVNVTFHEINGIYNATVEDGVAIVEVPGLNGNATYHIAKVVYSGNDVYYGFTVEDERITIEVAQAPSVVDIWDIPDTIYPANLTITYMVYNATTINVTVYNGEMDVIYQEQIDASSSAYLGAVNLTDLPAGRYTIVVVNYATDNYDDDADFVGFNVLKTDSGLTSIASENNTVGGNVTITVLARKDATGNVSISVDGELVVKDLSLVNGTVQFNVSGLAAGHHSYLVVYDGDSNYDPSMDENSFDVVKNDLVINSTSLDITVPKDTTTAIFTLTLPEDATGYLLVDIDGEPYYAPVENGTAILIVPGLNAGNYTANVTYTGDDKYAPVSNMTNVTVPSNLPENAISIPSSSSTYSPTYGVTLPKDAIGFIEVDVDGNKYYAVVQDGKASVSVPGLSTGAHNVTVTYSGDEKYTKISKSATVILTEPVVILVGTNVKYIYSADGEYKVVVTIDGAPAVGKTVTINFNGKNYNVVTDSKGYATLKLNTKVKPKKYTVTTTFMGAKATNKVTIKHIVKAKDAKVKQSKKVNKVKVALKKVDGKYLSGKKITIKFKGKKYKVKTNDKGKAKWKVKSSVLAKLKVGKKYKYSVTYGKDKVTKKLKIKK